VIVQATRLYKRYGADPVCKPLLGLLHSGVQNGLFCTCQVASPSARKARRSADPARGVSALRLPAVT
jgi:hypothetical protein